MKKSLSFLLVLLLLLGAANPSALAQAENPTQTIMVYIVGSDLESDGSLATHDIMEMMRSNFDQERLTVLLMTGGSKTWGNAVMKTDSLGIYQVDRRGPTLLKSEELRSMGEADTLSLFMNYAKEHHPADSYGLILWDHGGGSMIGFGVDYLHKKDGLTLLELRKALENSPFQGDERLEWLAFDACLMATVEVGLMMSPFAKYMIASEETLPGQGFSYSFLQPLSQGKLDGISAGQLIIDHTHAHYEALQKERPRFAPLVTLSVMDLDQVGKVGQAVENLFGSLAEGLDMAGYSDLARSRDGAKAYGLTATGDHYDLVDLYDLAQRMQSADPELTGALQQAITETVVYNKSNIPRSNGLSVYFPFNSKGSFENRWRELYGAFEILPDYALFMGRFGEILLSNALSSWTGDAAPQAAYDAQAGSYQLQLSPEQVANFDRGEYYVLARLAGEQYRLIYVSSDVSLDAQGQLNASFDGRVLHLVQGQDKPQLLPFLRQTEKVDQLSNYQIPMLLQRRNAEESLETILGQLLARLDHQSGQAQITGAILDDAQGTHMGKRDTDLSTWDSIGFPYLSYFLTLDDSGKPLTLGDWTASDDLFVLTMNLQQDLRITYELLDPEAFDYFVMMAVVDTQGYVYPSDLMPYHGDTSPQQGAAYPDRPKAREFSLDQENFVPTLLQETDQGLRLSLTGLRFSAENPGDRVAPDQMVLEVLAENTSDNAFHIVLDWLSVNGMMINPEANVSLGPRGSDLLLLPIDIAPNGYGTGLVDFGIKQVEDIRFRLSYFQQSLILTNTHHSDEIRFTTRIPVGAGYEQTQAEAFEPQVLSDSHGIKIEMTGPIFLQDDRVVIPLKITNQSEHFDRVRLVDSAINGIMSRLPLISELVNPGSVLVTQASIPLYPLALPEELEEYRELLTTENDLETLRISLVQQISLRFELDIASQENNPGRQSLSVKTDPITLYQGEQKPLNQPVDRKGDTLYEDDDLEIIRLYDDPEGRLLFVRNKTQRYLTLISFGMVKVDGADYSENQPIRLRLAPGSVAYHKLFSFLPGVLPDGGELNFRLSIVDTDENKLLHRTEPIALTLY